MEYNAIKRLHLVPLLILITAPFAVVADPPDKAPQKITPGHVIIPVERMQRPWGELISLDLAARTGKFRREKNDEVVSFTVMPYAELLHHAALGDLQDFRVGERALFRLHENEQGEWVWLTYIQDEMNMLSGHKEYFFVDSIQKEKRHLICTQATVDKSFVREQGIVIEIDQETRYWKAGRPAEFDDIHVADKLRTKTHGVGKGRVRVAWDVFLDDESLLNFQAAQKQQHAERLRQEGLPGFVDEVTDGRLSLTLFPEGAELTKGLKDGMAIRVAPAGVDRKPTAEPTAGLVTSATTNGRTRKAVIRLEGGGALFHPTHLARLWIVEK